MKLNKLFFSMPVLWYASMVHSAPTVTGNQISWPDDGWYQVQNAATYEQACAGGQSCEVEAGTYYVINHTTGERFTAVVASSGTPTEPSSDGVVVNGNTISWPNDGWYQVQNAATYEQACSGGRSCEVGAGRYYVINHTTGDRFTAIVTSPDSPTTPDDDTVMISGNVISWPDDGWYQVQNSETYEQICSGGRSCEVLPGIYFVINHTTGKRSTIVATEEPNSPLPSIPTSVSAAEADEGTILVTWESVSDANAYNVYISDSSPVIAGADGVTQYSSENPYLLISDNLIAGTTYYMAVSATANEQESALSSTVSATLTSEPVVVPAPVNVSAVGIVEAIEVTWGSVAEASTYNLYVSESTPVVIGASGVLRYTSESSSLVITDNLTVGTVYYIAVSAEADGNESALSGEVSATPDTPPVTAEPGMVVIPSGTFTMGCLEGEDGEPGRDNAIYACQRDEYPAHDVTVPSFQLGKTEVTFAQWDACVEAGGCNDYEPDDAGWGRGNRPVINIGWKSVQSYLSWLRQTTKKAYRLPSEAEWEYAARAGNNTSVIDYRSGNANCSVDTCIDLFEFTAPVGSFSANAFGLFDMIGNVWEMTSDCRHDSYTGAPTDGSAWLTGGCSYHMIRGGSWDSHVTNMRISNRTSSSNRGATTSGFRLALDLAQ